MENIDIEEMFAALGPVAIKRMFGGKGVYHQGHIVAVVVRGDMLLKADALSGPAFEAAHATQWTYQREGKAPIKMPYWSVPEEAFDDPDVMARWVKLAFEAALRSGCEKKKAKKK
jgi:DNA transformation protein